MIRTLAWAARAVESRPQRPGPIAVPPRNEKVLYPNKGVRSNGREGKPKEKVLEVWKTSRTFWCAVAIRVLGR